jgi:hypothetical protein
MGKMNRLFVIGFTAVASILSMPCLGDDARPKKFHPSSDPANRGGWVLNEAISDEFEDQQSIARKSLSYREALTLIRDAFGSFPFS